MQQAPNNIKVVTARDLRSNFKEIVDNINDYGETVIVARPKNKNVPKKNMILCNKQLIFGQLRLIKMHWKKLENRLKIITNEIKFLLLKNLRN